MHDGLELCFPGAVPPYVAPPPPPGLRWPATQTAREYQVTGAVRLLDSQRIILGDDAGLGKTLQAAMAAVRPVLVVCPTYLVWQWAEFLEEQFPEDTIAVASGDRAQRHKALTGSDDLTTLVGKPATDWTICNTDMLRSYMMPEVETVILDEAHHFRNGNAERSKNAAELCKRIPRVYQLTATPIYKDVSNFWHLLHMLDADQYPSYWDFVDRVAITNNDRYSTKIIRMRSPKALERELQPYLLRRTYKEVGLFLPPIIESHKVIELSPQMKKIYEQLRDYYRKEDGTPVGSAGEILHLLRHATVGPKIDVIPDILDDNPGPAVVFCWYRETAQACADRLKELYSKKSDPVVIHGDAMKPEERAPAAHAAIAAGGVVVATMASLGEGVNLSASKNVVFLEEDHVPGMMYQTLKRVQRWTEDERPVLAHYIRCRNTVDTIIHRVVNGRKMDAQQILREALD